MPASSDPRPAPPFDVSIDEALALVLETAAAAPRTSETLVPVRDALGRHLARPVHAAWDLPGAPTAVMDGWAVRAADLPSTADGRGLPVAAESAAGHPSDAPLPTGAVARISTGAVLPEGADAVVPQEETARERDRVTFDDEARAETQPGRYVRPAGSDVERGAVLLDAGATVGPGEFALLASAGAFEVPVFDPPTVALLGTGDELVAVGDTPARGQVVSTNVDMLAAQVRHAGGEPRPLGDVGDQPEALAAALQRGLQARVLVTTGGASVGDHDLVYAQLERLGLRPRFHKIALRPGRPTFFGLVGETLVLGLPGNPGSAHVAFELLGRPLVRRLCGVAEARCGWPRRAVELTEAVRPMARRTKFERARIEAARGRGSLSRATPLASQASGALRSIADYDVLLRIEPGDAPLEAGAIVDALEVRW